MDENGRAKQEPESSNNPGRTSYATPLFAMTAMDGGNENNAWNNYFSMAPRHTVHPVHKRLLFK